MSSLAQISSPLEASFGISARKECQKESKKDMETPQNSKKPIREYKKDQKGYMFVLLDGSIIFE